MLSVFVFASYAQANVVTNGSFELPADNTAPSNWDAWGGSFGTLTYRGTIADFGFAAEDGTRMVKIDCPGAGEWNGFLSDAVSYTSGDLITMTGYVKLTGDIGGGDTAKCYTTMKIQFYTSADGSGDPNSTYESTYLATTRDWELQTILDKSDNAAHSMRFVVTAGATGTGSAFTNSVYWDNVSVSVSAVPEPSVMFLFGTGLAGLLGAGWRRFRAAKA